jgi:hypothetical protein
MLSVPQSVFASFRLDPGNACVWRGPEMLTLTPKAFTVLQYLVAHAGQLVTKEVLLATVWPGMAVSEGVLKVCLSEIEYRNFTRYCATGPLGMHPLGCGGHQHPPSRSRGLPAAGQPCWQPAGHRPAPPGTARTGSW